MFEILPNPSLEMMLIVGRALLLVGAFWVFALAFTRWRREAQHGTQLLHNQLERAFAEMRSLHETVAVMNARLEAMSERAEVAIELLAPQRAIVALASIPRENRTDLFAGCVRERDDGDLLSRHARRARSGRSQPFRSRGSRPDGRAKRTSNGCCTRRTESAFRR